MSYRLKRQRLTKQQRWLVITSLLLMLPVLLDALKVISLGKWRLAPIFILLISSGAMVGGNRKTDRT